MHADFVRMHIQSRHQVQNRDNSILGRLKENILLQKCLPDCETRIAIAVLAEVSSSHEEKLHKARKSCDVTDQPRMDAQ